MENAPLARAVRNADLQTLRASTAVASSLSLNLVTTSVTQLHQIARLHASVAEQQSRAIEAPRRCAILSALRRALDGQETSLLDFDPTLPENAAAYRQALDDVRSEVAADGRVIRAAAATLAFERLRGKAPR